MAVKKQADISCMFCGNTPCSCDGIAKTKKTVTPKKKLADNLSVPKVNTQEPAAQVIQRASLASMSSKIDNIEREALTALFKVGFILEIVGDSRGFDAVRPMLNMSPVDIDINLWKIRRSQCQAPS